ncbi:hypothetical protein RRF57_007401 [Xylaria bambusicola]|uniref:Major facilitator superfamily (MFS) profile domain-containing protein n=1 Tax=Xylaria bambusicola TaxID=326684 RepID=A0AAN7Z7J1_9PEZI
MCVPNAGPSSASEGLGAISPAHRVLPAAPPEKILKGRAAKFIAQHGEVDFDYEDERAVPRRRHSEQTLRTSYWSAMNGITQIVGSLITHGLDHMIFIFCGVTTFQYSLIFLVMLNFPMEAKYLSKREQLIAVERLRANRMGVASYKWRWDHALETLLDSKTWLWFLIMASASVHGELTYSQRIASGGIGTFGNLTIKDFGYTDFNAALFNIPFGVIQVVSIIASAALAAKIRRKGLVIALANLVPITGTILMATGQNAGGDTKKKTTTGVMIVGMCLGNIIGRQSFNTRDAPLYRPGLISALVQFSFVGTLGL